MADFSKLIDTAKNLISAAIIKTDRWIIAKAVTLAAHPRLQKHNVTPNHIRVGAWSLFAVGMLYLFYSMLSYPNSQDDLAAGQIFGQRCPMSYRTFGPVTVLGIEHNGSSWMMKTQYLQAGSSVPTTSTQSVSEGTVRTTRGLGTVELTWGDC
jgi:hypothetical protein